MEMLHTVVSGDRGGYVWRLTRSTPYGADVLATGCRSYTDEAACYRAVDELRRVAPKAAKIVQEADGHWRWVVSDDQGLPLAESPPLFRDADSCARAFGELHDELSAVLSR
jgi:hypothetical protein